MSARIVQGFHAEIGARRGDARRLQSPSRGFERFATSSQETRGKVHPGLSVCRQLPGFRQADPETEAGI